MQGDDHRYCKQGLNITADSLVEGLRLTVSSDELRALYRYERLGIRYRRIRVTLDDGSTAWVYQRIEPDAAALPVPAHTTLISGNGRFSAMRWQSNRLRWWEALAPTDRIGLFRIFRGEPQDIVFERLWWSDFVYPISTP